MNDLDKNKLYRIPWSLYDNPIGWVEITDRCNMVCKGCYRNYIEIHQGHKSIKEIKNEILFMKNERNVSEISLSGGEPLLHPHLIEIIHFASQQSLGVKIFSNGKGLKLSFLHKLVSAGLSQITFHIDSFQTRNDEWDNKSEIELNELRQYFVNMCQNLTALNISFSSMVTRENLKFIPSIVRWALNNKGSVGGLAFFALRNYKPIKDEKKPELVNIDLQDNVTSKDIYEAIRKNFSHYNVSAYFGGTANPKSFKWLFSITVCSANKLIGSLGPISIELYQVMSHLIYRRYAGNNQGKKSVGNHFIKFICLLFDRNIHRILFDIVKNPKLLSNPLYLLSIIIVQAHDISIMGNMDVCDGCPDMTYFKGRLVQSCRLDEFRKYGRFITELREEKIE